MEDAQLQALKARTMVDSPEFKQQMEDMKRQMAEATAHMNNPEFKRQMEELQKDLQSDEFRRKLDEDIWRAKEKSEDAPSQPDAP
jgi:bla regulator protein BlaR1